MKTGYKFSTLSIFPLAVFCLAVSYVQSQSQDKSNEVMQREVIRRNELLLRATKALSEAELLIQQGNDQEARKKIDETLSTIPASGEGKEVYVRASAISSILESREAELRFKKKDYFSAREHALKALEYSKNNKAADVILTKSNKALGIEGNADKPANPAVDRKFVSNLNKVEENIGLARDYMATGDYDAADEKLKAALAIDPYNKAAASEALKLQKMIRKAREEATKSSRQERLTEVREGWTEKYKMESALEKPDVKPVVLKAKTNFAVNQKLQSIVIPQVLFNDATIDDAVKFLSLKTRELDESGIGVNFLIRSEKARTEAKNFSLKLKNVPAAEVLRYICSLAGVKFKVEEFAVFIVPLSENDQVLVSRDFPVRQSFFDVEVSSGDDSSGGAEVRRRRPTTETSETADPIKEALVSRGVQFPEGAAALYNSVTGLLTVRNTQDQIDLVEELVTENQGETLLVRVETRLVEIKQKDLDSLSFNYNLAGSTGPITGAFSGGTQFGTADIKAGTNLLGQNGINESDGINRIINLTPSTGSAANPVAIQTNPNRFGISGVLDGNAFGALMEAVSQKDGTDLVTAPSILVNDGSQGTVEVAREFYYPTEFDQAQASVELAITSTIDLVSSSSSSTRRVTIVPSWPTSFEKRNVGVTLNVQPRVTVDRKRVYLTIKPDIVEFDGFINYGSRIFGDSTIVDGEIQGTPPVLNDNVVNQPVFSVRTVENAQLEIQDGYTMVLGGLIREDISTVEDKVPLLGDIPLVGRLFRSKAEQAVKNNLLIFVTVRILRPDGEPFNAAATKLAQVPTRN